MLLVTGVTLKLSLVLPELKNRKQLPNRREQAQSILCTDNEKKEREVKPQPRLELQTFSIIKAGLPCAKFYDLKRKLSQWPSHAIQANLGMTIFRALPTKLVECRLVKNEEIHQKILDQTLTSAGLITHLQQGYGKMKTTTCLCLSKGP